MKDLQFVKSYLVSEEDFVKFYNMHRDKLGDGKIILASEGKGALGLKATEVFPSSQTFEMVMLLMQPWRMPTRGTNFVSLTVTSLGNWVVVEYQNDRDPKAQIKFLTTGKVDVCSGKCFSCRSHEGVNLDRRDYENLEHMLTGFISYINRVALKPVRSVKILTTRAVNDSVDFYNYNNCYVGSRESKVPGEKDAVMLLDL